MKIGSLFHGTGALDLAVADTWGAELAWYSENDRNVARIPAWNHPGVPNLGDVTAVDWASVPPIDILTGGSPCQDLSESGKRGGMRDGTRSNLWVEMREAIAVLQPSLIVWENVRGSYSSPADSEVERCPRCVGVRDGGGLRALGRVLGDLADLGYDARWHGLGASEVGAPHERWRVFLLAYPTGSAPPYPVDEGPIHRCGVTGGWPESELDLRSRRLPSLPERGHWGRFQPAVNRWARLTRPAPFPVAFNPTLQVDQITPEFIEWMMGLPHGWVHGVPGLDRLPANRALGNAVVPAQAKAAFRLLTEWAQ